jgi:hypothetical protein
VGIVSCDERRGELRGGRRLRGGRELRGKRELRGGMELKGGREWKIEGRRERIESMVGKSNS